MKVLQDVADEDFESKGKDTPATVIRTWNKPGFQDIVEEINYSNGYQYHNMYYAIVSDNSEFMGTKKKPVRSSARLPKPTLSHNSALAGEKPTIEGRLH